MSIAGILRIEVELFARIRRKVTGQTSIKD